MGGLGADIYQIQTNLPSSESGFEFGIEEIAQSLSAALAPGGAASISKFAGAILIACIIGHNVVHISRKNLADHPEDFANGEYWKRHRKLDNQLSNILMSLPRHLIIPGGSNDPNVLFVNVNIHTSIITLHQAAILMAEKNNLGNRIIKSSQDRCTVSAMEIVNIMCLAIQIEFSIVSFYNGL
jgi:hypothetical protein